MLNRLKFFITNLLLIFPIVFITSCGGPTLNATRAYNDCSYRFENIVKVDECAKSMMSTFASQNGGWGAVYGRGDSDVQFYQGLVYKVSTNQISNSDALNRYNNYLAQKKAKASRLTI